LGFLIGNSENFLRISELYATVVAASLFAGVVYILFEILDRKLIFWRPHETRG
jgi:ABC-type nitrate/sulfonate/bicarbonate transport system permease component